MTDRPLPPGFPRSKDEQARGQWTCKAGAVDCTRKAPCRSCLNRRNRRSGMRKQREARKALEVVTGKQAARFASLTSNEEGWSGLPIRVEVKSGAQVGAIWTKYAAAEAQSAAAKSIGDTRPFVMVAMGQRTSDGLVLIRLSQLAAVMQTFMGMKSRD